MKSSCGSVWLTSVRQLHVGRLEVLPGRRDVGAVLERDLDRRFEVDRLRRRGRQVGRHNRGAPQLVVRAADDEALQRELVVAERGLRVDQRLPARGFVGLRLHDVDRRHRADLDPRAVVRRPASTPGRARPAPHPPPGARRPVPNRRCGPAPRCSPSSPSGRSRRCPARSCSTAPVARFWSILKFRSNGWTYCAWRPD